MVRNLLLILGEIFLATLPFLFANWIGSRVIRSLEKLRFVPTLAILRDNLKVILLIFCLLSMVAIVGINGYWLYQEKDLYEHTRHLLTTIPDSFWENLGLAFGQSLAAIVLLWVGLRIIRYALTHLREWLAKSKGIKSDRESLDKTFHLLTTTIVRAAWLSLFVQIFTWFGAPESFTGKLFTGIEIYLIICAALLCWRCVDAVIESLDALSQRFTGEQNLLRYYDKLRILTPLLKRCIEYIIYIAAASAASGLIEFTAPFSEIGVKLIRIISVIFLSRVVFELIKLIVEESLVLRPKLTPEEKQTRLTMVPLLLNLVRYVIYFGVTVIALKEFGIDPMPILAGASVVGIAVGLGSQALMKDVVTGFSILFENYYLVGDYVKIGENEGFVESIDILNTRLRDEDGRLHIIRNGEISNPINFTRNQCSAVVNVGVAYNTQLKDCYEAIERLGAELCEQEEGILEPTKVEGLEEFGQHALIIRTVTEVKSGTHLALERLIRLRLKERFDELGIEIPLPHQVIDLRQKEK